MSTVHICLNDIFGVAVACEVIFYPGDTPFFSGSALAVSGARSIRLDADGNGSVTLLPGRYAVRFSGITSNTDTLLILVPSDDASYALSELICGGNWVLPMRDFLQAARNLGDVANPASAFEAIKQSATAASSGVVCLATQAEVDAGSDASKCVTPATLAHAAYSGKVRFLTVADAAARLALIPADVNVGDLVEQLDTQEVYQVLDTALLAHDAGYVDVGDRAALPASGLMQGLVAYWKLDEASGLRTDATGNGHDLSDNNGVGFAAGKVGNAASFDGTNYLSCLNPTPDGGEFTCCFWTKVNGYQVGSVGIAAWGGAGGGNQWMFFVFESVWSFLVGGSWAPLGIVGNLSSDWSFVVLQCDGSVAKVKVNNGGWAVSDSLSGTLSGAQGDCLFTIGAAGDGMSGFPSGFDEVGLWNRALSDEEITQLYNNGNGRSYPF